MKIEITKIPEEGYWINEDAPIKAYALSYPLYRFLTPLSLHLFVSKVSNDLLVRGDVKTQVMSQCVRCLRECEINLHLKEFTFCEGINQRQIIDLTEPLREEIILSLSAKPLCGEHCKGLCARCGQDLNQKLCSCKKEDFRLTDLNKLKFD